MRGRRPSWIACCVTENAPVITAWLAMTVATVAKITSGSSAQSGRQQEERVVQSLGVLQDQGTLAEIVQRQGGEHQPGPGSLDRRPPEMAHVGVERLGAGDREEHAAQDDEADRAVREQEAERMAGVEGHEHAQIVAEMEQPEPGHDQEPHGGDRPEQGRHLARALPLGGEQGQQDRRP